MNKYPPIGNEYPETPNIEHLYERIINSEVIYHHFLAGGYAGPYTYTEGSGATTANGNHWRAATGTTSGSLAFVRAGRREAREKTPPYTWERERVWKAVVEFENDANQKAYAVMGDGYGTRQHVGFYVENDTLYMSVSDGSTENHSSVQTFTATADFTLKAKFYSGRKAEFWVDGDKVGELTSNLPTGTLRAHEVQHIYVENTAAANKAVDFEEGWFLQKES